MAGNTAFALRGSIVHSPRMGEIEAYEDHYLVCEDGRVAGVFPALPDRFAGLEVRDHRGSLILPGLVDLHLHAPQFAFRGLGMDLELLEWLNTVTFPEEAKYGDLAYARRAYELFIQGMVQGATTRACVFSTLHVNATLLLMDLLEDSGLSTFVGKVNMDRNSPDDLQEESAHAALAATRDWLSACEGVYARTKPILTPRFVPSCSDELMRGLAVLQKETGLPVQSHLSENPSEVAWVKELCPEAESYADAYAHFGLLGGEGCPTVMAHCVHPHGNEIELLRERGVYVAHCPISNGSLSSGVAPVRRYVQEGIRVGLGTDIAGGFSPSIFRVMADAVQHSKLRWRLQDDSLSPLTVAEAFYMATKGGGAFFGKVGSFEEGYEFDAVVVDDARLPCPFPLTAQQRLERVVHLSDDGAITAKYAAGRQVKGQKT